MDTRSCRWERKQEAFLILRHSCPMGSPLSFIHSTYSLPYDIFGLHIKVNSNISILMAKMNRYFCPTGQTEGETEREMEG